MSQKYTEGFKIQAVEKALNRSAEITLTEVAEQLGVSLSVLCGKYPGNHTGQLLGTCPAHIH